MSPQVTRLAWGIVIGSLLLAVALLPDSHAQNARSKAPEELVPRDAVLLIQLDGAEEHADAYSKTAAYEALYESGLVPVIEKALTNAMLVNAGPNDVAGPVGAVMTHLHQNGVVAALSFGSEVQQQAPIAIPQVTIVLPNGGQFAEPMGALIQQAGRVQAEVNMVDGRKVTSFMIPDSPGIEIGWWVESSHLVLAAGIQAVDFQVAVTTGDEPNLTSSALWKKYGSNAAFEQTSLVCFDLGRVRDTYGNIPLPVPARTKDGGPLTIAAIAEILGLDNVGAVACRSGYSGRAIRSVTTLEVDGDKRGLMALCDQAAISLDDLPPLPADTTGFVAGSFDAGRFYKTALQLIQDGVELGPPQVQAQAGQTIENLPQMIGFDPGADLFDTLGNTFAVYLDQGQNFLGVGGAGLVIEVDDADRLRDTINHITLMIEGISQGRASFVRSEQSGREVITLKVEGFEFGGLVVDDKWLGVGLVPQTVTAFLMRLDGKLDRWTPAEDVQQALAELPQEFTGITISQPREMYRALFAFAPLLFSGASGAAQEAGLFENGGGFGVTMADVPPTELIVRPLFANVAVSVVDENGIHWLSRDSMPSIPLVGAGGTGSVATVGVLTALLLPAVQQAREAARRAQSKNNLKQIGLAMHNYHEVYNRFPAGTIEESAEDVDDRLSWYASILPFVEQQALYEQLDKTSGWASEDNEGFTSITIPMLLNPQQAVQGPGETHYVGMAGIGEDAATLPVNSPRAGMFGYNRATRLRDITDGTSNTIAVSEAVDGIGPWAAGGHATVRPITEQPYINGPDGIGSRFAGGCNVLFADGSVRFISENIDPQLFEALITISGGEPVGAF